MLQVQPRRLRVAPRKPKIVLTPFDLCLSCPRDCKRAGPLWSRLECPSFAGTEHRFDEYRLVNMTDEELVARVAFG
jgi:hypothetical protein